MIWVILGGFHLGSCLLPPSPPIPPVTITHPTTPNLLVRVFEQWLLSQQPPAWTWTSRSVLGRVDASGRINQTREFPQSLRIAFTTQRYPAIDVRLTMCDDGQLCLCDEHTSQRAALQQWCQQTWINPINCHHRSLAWRSANRCVSGHATVSWLRESVTAWLRFLDQTPGVERLGSLLRIQITLDLWQPQSIAPSGQASPTNIRQLVFGKVASRVCFTDTPHQSAATWLVQGCQIVATIHPAPTGTETSTPTNINADAHAQTHPSVPAHATNATHATPSGFSLSPRFSWHTPVERVTHLLSPPAISSSSSVESIHGGVHPLVLQCTSLSHHLNFENTSSACVVKLHAKTSPSHVFCPFRSFLTAQCKQQAWILTSDDLNRWHTWLSANLIRQASSLESPPHGSGEWTRLKSDERTPPTHSIRWPERHSASRGTQSHDPQRIPSTDHALDFMVVRNVVAPMFVRAVVFPLVTICMSFGVLGLSFWVRYHRYQSNKSF